MAAVSIGAAGQEGEDRDLRLAWSDEFFGVAGSAPDPARWNFETFGHGNATELQCYTDSQENTALDGAGHLVITADEEPDHTCVDGITNDYTSGRITTQESQTFTYGRFEMRAKVPAGVGTWPAFWALGENIVDVDWPRSGEIDVMEYAGRIPTTVLGTVHGPTTEGERWFVGDETTVEEPLSDGFHTFTLDWSEDLLVWSLDGAEYARVTRDQAEEQGDWVFDKPFYLLLNLAVGGIYGGDVPDETVFPQAFVVDYVRVYQ